MDDVALANYIAGVSRDHVDVGRVGSELARALGGYLGETIWLSDYSFTKIRFRHSDITFQDYCLIPMILSNAAIIAGKKRKKRTAELSIGPSVANQKPGYRLCMKPTKDGVFVTTFHKLSLREARRHIRKGVKNGTLVRADNQGLAKQISRFASPA